jgi:alkylresorcinol/alkylpyrone synthase
MKQPKILAAATALPARRYTQQEILEACAEAFPDLMRRPAHRDIFENAGVFERYLAEPLPFYLEGHDFETRNNAHIRHALALARAALRSCADRAGRSLDVLSHLLSVTTTGLATPSIEARLAQEMSLPRAMERTPIFGAGCAGGAVGLARAAAFLRGRPEAVAAVLSAELCSLCFDPAEPTLLKIVSAALFGDGAAAVLLAGPDAEAGQPVAEILASASFLIPDSLHVMGWDFTERGMRLLLSPDAPRIVEQSARQAVEPFLKSQGLGLRDVDLFLLHPGSLKILESFEKALGLSPEHTRLSRDSLRRYGNISSASVLFILEEALRTRRPKAGSTALLAAMGPGFSCEMSLLRLL